MPDEGRMEKRQQVLADFGEFALRSDDLDAVLTEACRLVADALGTGRAKVLEIEDEGRSLFVRAGVGWNEDVVGRVHLPMSDLSSETYSIAASEPVITNDLAREERFDVPAFMKEAGVKALANVPIFLPGGRPFGLLQVDAPEPRVFRDAETQFLRTYATILGPVIDRLIKLQSLSETEERFRTIVEAAHDYAIFLTDPQDRITDWLAGAEAVFGWTAQEVVGQPAAILFTPEDRQAGVPEAEVRAACEGGSAPDVRWHLRKDGSRVFIEGSVGALRNGAGGLRGFQKIGQDVTKRHLAEEMLRESEARQSFLLKLNDTMRALGHTPECLEAVTRLLGEHLGAARVNYAEVEGEDYVVSWEYRTPGLASMAGRYSIGDFRSAERFAFEAGQTVAVADILDTELASAQRSAYDALGVRAFVSVPLVRAGKLVVVLSVILSQAHRWHPAEVTLIEETAGRMWSTLESARANAKRRESETRYRQLFDSIDQGFCIIKVIIDEANRPVDYRFLEVNAAFERQTGLKDAEGRTMRSFMPEHEEFWFEIYGRIALSGRPERFEHVAEKLAAYYEVYAFPVGAPDRRQVGILFNDIADRRRAEAAIRDSESRFRTLAITMPQLVWRAQSGGHWVWASPRWTACTGQSFEASLGLGWLDMVHPQDREQTMQAWRDAVDTGGLDIEHRLWHSDGRWAWFQTAARPVPGPDNDTVEWCGACSDVTSLKDMEADLRAGRAEADRARTEAEAANAAKTRFLGAVSHDLRQPVMAANLMIDLLAKRHHPDQEIVAHLRDALGNLTGMLNGLLESARLEAGLVKAEIREFPLDDLLHRLYGEFDVVAHEAGLRLHIAPVRDLVSSDPLLVELILRNLIANAIKFTEEGGITVTTRRNAGMMAIAVRDTGRGIAPDQLDHIFDEYRQVGEAVVGRSRGFGIGLSTVRRVADVLGATVEVRSDLGSGSTFTVHLPLAEPERNSIGDPTGASSPFAGRSALVVDDEALVRTALELMLRDRGFEVQTARSLGEAMARLESLERMPDVVLSDYNLTNGEFGTEVIAQAQKRSPTIASVLITGETTPDRLAEIERSGCRILHKPIDPDKLVRLLASLLGLT